MSEFFSYLFPAGLVMQLIGVTVMFVMALRTDDSTVAERDQKSLAEAA